MIFIVKWIPILLTLLLQSVYAISPGNPIIFVQIDSLKKVSKIELLNSNYKGHSAQSITFLERELLIKMIEQSDRVEGILSDSTFELSEPKISNDSLLINGINHSLNNVGLLKVQHSKSAPQLLKSFSGYLLLGALLGLSFDGASSLITDEKSNGKGLAIGTLSGSALFVIIGLHPESSIIDFNYSIDF
jgi:hypothetical protein